MVVPLARRAALPLATATPERDDLAARARDLFRDLLFLPWSPVGPRHYLTDYLASQWLSAPELRELQLAGLRRMTWHCFLHVPAHARPIGLLLRPHEIEALDDVARLPRSLDKDRRRDPESYRAGDFIDEESIARRAALRMRAEAWTDAGRACSYAHAALGLIAARCEHGGLHVHADHLIVEILDRAGRPTATGEAGRIFVTDLHQRAAPFLRHELCDDGRFVHSPCACGRALPLLEVLGPKR